MENRYYRPDGEMFDYVPMSERVPRFWRRYPAEEGWSVASQFEDPLSLQRGRMELMKTAIANGHSPEAVGLGKLVMGQLVCRASLVRDGQEFVTRHAVGPVGEHKDLERLESVAFQRVLAALGFDGASLDEDEQADMEMQGIQPADEAVPAAPGGLSLVKPGELRGHDDVRATDHGAGPSAAQAKDTVKDAATQDAGAFADGPEEVPSAHEEIPLALQRQIETLARRLGEKPGKPATLKEAKALVVGLSRRLNPRSRNQAATG